MIQNRLKVNEFDKSGTTLGGATVNRGFLTVRAIKGNQAKVMVSQGNVKSVLNRFGTPNDKFPDIQEILDYVPYFDTYVSAPAGPGSTFGGLYVTAKGLFGFTQEADLDVDPETNLSKRVSYVYGTPVVSTANAVDHTITFAGIPASVIAQESATESETTRSLVLRVIEGTGGSARTVNFNLVFEKSGATWVMRNPSDEVIAEITVTGGLATLVLHRGVDRWNSVVVGADVLETMYANSLDTEAVGYKPLAYSAVRALDLSTSVIGAIFQTSPTPLKAYVSDVRIVPAGYTSADALDTLVQRKNTLSFKFHEDNTLGQTKLVGEYLVSPNSSAVNGMKESVYYRDILAGNEFLGMVMFQDITGTAVVNHSALSPDVMVPLTGAKRTIVDMTDVADYAGVLASALGEEGADTMLSHVLFMDQTGSQQVISQMVALRGGVHAYTDSQFISALPRLGGSRVVDATVVQAMKTMRLSLPNDRGLAYYWNPFKVKEQYTNTVFWSSLIGAVGVRITEIKEKAYGGLAPALTDENQMGGEIKRPTIEPYYKFKDPKLCQELNDLGINVIVNDPKYGVYISDHRTAQSPVNVTDTTWIAHSNAFDMFMYEVLTECLTPQAAKLNDSFHRSTVSAKARMIADKRLNPNLPIFSAVKIVCDETNNTREILAQRKFKLGIAVQVTPFSEFLEFDFYRVGQTSSVEDPFKA